VTAEISRDDALLWLNHHLGEHVIVTLVVDCGDCSAPVLHSEGALWHWSQRRDRSPVAAPHHPAFTEALIGLYSVGDDGSLNISEPQWPGRFCVRRHHPDLLDGGGVVQELAINMGTGFEVLVATADRD